MQSQEFCELFLDALRERPDPAATLVGSFADLGVEYSRYGAVVRTASGGHVLFQVLAVGISPPGGKGDPPPPIPRPTLGAAPPTPIAGVEEYAAWAVRDTADPRLRSVRRYSTHADLGGMRSPYGLEVTFHGTGLWRVLVQVPYTLPPGRRPESAPLYAPRETI